MRRVLSLTVAFAMLVAAARLTAQQPEVKPGPEHEGLKEAEGTWDATIKSMGAEFKGKATLKMALGGLWLMEHFTADFGGKPFEGYGATTYDPATKKYINTWIDSMVTRPMISEGTYDKGTKTMTMIGNMPTPDGKEMKVTMTTVMKDADTKTFTLTGAGPDGKNPEILQIIYKRSGK